MLSKPFWGGVGAIAGILGVALAYYESFITEDDINRPFAESEIKCPDLDRLNQFGYCLYFPKGNAKYGGDDTNRLDRECASRSHTGNIGRACSVDQVKFVVDKTAETFCFPLWTRDYDSIDQRKYVQSCGGKLEVDSAPIDHQYNIACCVDVPTQDS